MKPSMPKKVAVVRNSDVSISRILIITNQSRRGRERQVQLKNWRKKIASVITIEHEDNTNL